MTALLVLDTQDLTAIGQATSELPFLLVVTYPNSMQMPCVHFEPVRKYPVLRLDRTKYTLTWLPTPTHG